MTKNGKRALAKTGAKPRPIRMLIVEDSPILMETLQTFFESQSDFELVGTAVNGREAVRQAAALRPDLILMDGLMPEMSGLEATRSIKQRQDASVVILMTLEDTAYNRSTALTVGADGFIGKTPSFYAELLAAIRRAFPWVRIKGPKRA